MTKRMPGFFDVEERLRELSTKGDDLERVKALALYVDVAIEKTALCIVDREGAVVRETNVASDPDALADCLAPYHLKLARLGLEAGPLSEWLVRGLERHGFPAVLMETRHVRAALSARIAKTDRKDARGMAARGSLSSRLMLPERERRTPLRPSPCAPRLGCRADRREFYKSLDGCGPVRASEGEKSSHSRFRSAAA